MQNVDIQLERQYIYEYVTTLTGNLGRQRGDYDKFVCLPDNYPVLDRYFDTAIAVLEASVWRRLSGTYSTTLQYNNGTLSVHIKADSLPEHLVGALETNTRLAMAYILAGMWLQGIDAELYAHYSKLADEYINNISEIASQKDFSAFNYDEPLGDSSLAADGSKNKTGEQTDISDTISVISTAKTGQHQAVTDNIKANMQTAEHIGGKPIEDCCINRHSELDNAAFWPDGTVAYINQ